MKVIALKKPGGLDNLVVEERAEPQPKTGEILVRWRASSLNYHDYIVAKGGIPVIHDRIPMSDGAGEVVAVGEGVTQWQPGDKVMSLFYPQWLEGRPGTAKLAALTGETIDGCAVELACLPESAVTAMPVGLTFAEAATLPCAGVTAWRALMVEGGLKAGDTVLVQGTGGMSMIALQLAKAAGAYVFATSSSDDKLERLKALGADELVNYRTDSDWGKTINRLSGGGVDHVLDAGGGATLNQSVEAARVDGKVTLIGILGGRTATVDVPALFFKHLHINGIAVGSAAMQRDLVAAMNVNHIKPVLDRSFPLEALGDAFRYQETNAHFGKIVVEF
ncbi:MAG: NAD(P)-dependent alcohol dehydrogenase [Porticoccaceae bacterium]|nr:NAD(P)-dependent alcohol dehydrogenase [Porticoccaceae bacterium]